jgi:hypothetical protein
MTLIPTNSGLYLLLAICALAIFAVFFVMRQRLPLKLQRFDGRERLPLESIHDKFYPGYEMAMFLQLWREIASKTEVPPELMRPADRFDNELGPVKGFPIAGELDDLNEAFVRRCKQQKLDFHKAKVETVDDYIKLFAAPPNG